MLSNKDINFNDETQVLSINGEKHAVLGDPAIPGQIEDLDARVAAIEDAITEKFEVALSSAISNPDALDSDCYFNPITREVNIRVMIYSANGSIPVNSATVFNVPEKYRPQDNVQLGMAFLISSDGWDSRLTQMERCFLGSNGNFGLNNFVYGPKPTKLLYINTSYTI